MDNEPPFLLDGARVACYAILGDAAMRRGFSFVAGGVSISPASVSRMVVTENLLDETRFLLHCNEHWETVAAAPVPDVEAAKAAAAQAYEGIDIPWTTYRPLTDAERREMQTTTEFLRELAAGMLDE